MHFRVSLVRIFVPTLTLCSSRAVFESWWGREYDLYLAPSWNGQRLGDVRLERGGAGDQAVVHSANGLKLRGHMGESVSRLQHSEV